MAEQLKEINPPPILAEMKRGPFIDTGLSWFDMADGQVGFRATLYGYPRLLVGRSKGDLSLIAMQMRAGRA